MSDTVSHRFRIRYPFIAVSVLAILFVIWFNWAFVGDDAHKKVKPGMTPAQVLQVLGEPGGRIVDPNTRETAQWVYSRWPPARVMVVEFSNGRTTGSFNN